MNSQVENIETVAAPEAEVQATEAVEIPKVDSNEGTKFDAKHPWFLFLAIAFGGVCLIALGYVLFWVANAFLGGAGVSNSFMITSTVGRILTSVVFSVILAAAIISIVYAVKIFVSGGKDLAADVSHFSLLPSVMYLFSIFSLIDSGIIFFFSMLGDSIAGVGTQVIANSYDVISQILDFMGFSGLGVEQIALGMEDNTGGVILSILFGLCILAYAIAGVVLWGQVKDYHRTLINTAEGSQYDKGNKPPFIFSLVMAGLNLALAVVALISGNWVDAVIKIAIAVYLVGLALSFKSIHKVLHLTSID
ncbi:MAG: hypothetical protein IJ515_06235 [Clostridia bacterium]|nr:hypothetical protein [Clostridia bacterium]